MLTLFFCIFVTFLRAIYFSDLYELLLKFNNKNFDDTKTLLKSKTTANTNLKESVAHN